MKAFSIIFWLTYGNLNDHFHLIKQNYMERFVDLKNEAAIQEYYIIIDELTKAYGWAKFLKLDKAAFKAACKTHGATIIKGETK